MSYFLRIYMENQEYVEDSLITYLEAGKSERIDHVLNKRISLTPNNIYILSFPNTIQEYLVWTLPIETRSALRIHSSKLTPEETTNPLNLIERLFDYGPRFLLEMKNKDRYLARIVFDSSIQPFVDHKLGTNQTEELETVEKTEGSNSDLKGSLIAKMVSLYAEHS